MICVDNIMPVFRITGKWKWKESCHLFSDYGDLDELHEFAKSIGLKREWFQDRGFPHYDLTRRKRELAVMKGAMPVTRKKLVEAIKRCRQNGR